MKIETQSAVRNIFGQGQKSRNNRVGQMQGPNLSEIVLDGWNESAAPAVASEKPNLSGIVLDGWVEPKKGGSRSRRNKTRRSNNRRNRNNRRSRK